MKIEGQVRIPSGCAIAAVISKEGNKMSGEMIYNAMKPMHDRSNGLGGGFAGYGIYPEYKEFYALHMFFDSRATRKECEVLLKERFEIVKSEIIPTRTIPAITDEPIIWRYFVAPLKSVLASMQLDEKEFVARTVMKSNTEMKGAYVFSSGKNMGTFKAVGVRANTTLIKEIGDEVNRGILVNDRMETSLESIYAAGDCTEGNDIFLGQKRVLALLPNAYMQEHTAGVNMTGGNEVFGKAIPMNSIGFFGLHIMKAGTYVGEMY